jgi:U3 small nucleolar RNA-associated protein 11
MSSLRNAVKRVTHKERAQPASRKHLGLLEKHKDYVLRAKDFNKKRDRMKALRLRASMRNPDEFYFAMNSTKTKEGIHSISTAPTLDHDTVKLLKTQDLGYLRMKVGVDEGKVQKLRAGLHMLGAERPAGSHTIFVKSKKDLKSFDPATHFDTAPELADRAFNRPRLETLQTKTVTGAKNRKQMKTAIRQQRVAYAEMHQREERARKLRVAASHLEVERAVTNGKGVKRKVKEAEGDAPAVFKWKRQRAK